MFILVVGARTAQRSAVQTTVTCEFILGLLDDGIKHGRYTLLTSTSGERNK